MDINMVLQTIFMMLEDLKLVARLYRDNNIEFYLILLNKFYLTKQAGIFKAYQAKRLNITS